MLRSRLRSTGGVTSHLYFYQNKFYRQELIIAIEFDYNLEKGKAIFIYMIELIIFYDYVAQCNFFEDVCIRRRMYIYSTRRKNLLNFLRKVNEFVLQGNFAFFHLINVEFTQES